MANKAESWRRDILAGTETKDHKQYPRAATAYFMEPGQSF